LRCSLTVGWLTLQAHQAMDLLQARRGLDSRHQERDPRQTV